MAARSESKAALHPELQYLYHTQPGPQSYVSCENHAARSSFPVAVDDAKTADVPYVVQDPYGDSEDPEEEGFLGAECEDREAEDLAVSEEGEIEVDAGKEHDSEGFNSGCCVVGAVLWRDIVLAGSSPVTAEQSVRDQDGNRWGEAYHCCVEHVDICYPEDDEESHWYQLFSTLGCTSTVDPGWEKYADYG